MLSKLKKLLLQRASPQRIIQPRPILGKYVSCKKGGKSRIGSLIMNGRVALGSKSYG
jgi:hypothetical protein